MLPTVTSPHAGETAARQTLNDRFAERVAFDPEFTRRTVSYQGNRQVPGLRWMKYKEGFSGALVACLLDEHEPHPVVPGRARRDASRKWPATSTTSSGTTAAAARSS